jgi:RND family efflux transporter MFP subunit
MQRQPARQRQPAHERDSRRCARNTSVAASAARTRAAWRTVVAPYSAHVTEMFVTAGDLATPGRSLVALYDPAALRVVAQVPESVASQLQTGATATLAVDLFPQPIQATSWTVVSAVDPATHSVEVRVELPAGLSLRPGQFVRVALPMSAPVAQLRIPSRAVLRRSEVTGVYVIDAAGVPRLRQVRLGRIEGDNVVVLAGLQGNEVIALDPVAAGRR